MTAEDAFHDRPEGAAASDHNWPDSEACELLPVLSSSDLAAGDFSVDYLIDDIAVRGQPGIVGGPEKSLKTSLCVDFGLSLATGNPFLGKFSVSRPARVLFCSGESGLGTLKNTAMEVAASKRIDLAGVGGLLWSEALPNLGRHEERQKLIATIRKHGVECLIVDPVYLALLNSDPWNLFAQGELLRDISNACREAGATLILVHHAKKNRADRNAPPQLTDLSGSGFAEFARWWILLSRREEYSPPDPHQLWLATGGSTGHSGAWALDIDQGEFARGRPRQWKIDIQTRAEFQQSTGRRKAEEKAAAIGQRVEQDAPKVIEKMREFPSGETKSVLRAKAGLNSDRVNTALRLLRGRGSIEEVMVPKSGKLNGVPGYRIAC
jgi:hypothetical protein